MINDLIENSLKTFNVLKHFTYAAVLEVGLRVLVRHWGLVLVQGQYSQPMDLPVVSEWI